MPHDRSAVIEGPDLNCSRGPLDKKLYRQIILSNNGLRVVLISDTVAMGQSQTSGYDEGYDEDDDEDDDSMIDKDGDIDLDSSSSSSSEDEERDEIRKAAAAVIVGVGSYFDPPHAQGLAHFLEHMLFMGTKKYPQENAYDAFMSKYGGSDNAYTDMEHTIYHFEIIQEKFFQALDMFAQFFIEPLMLHDAVDRELNSIESEFQLSATDDESRLQQVMAYSSRNGSESWHPFGNFSWGNIQSLKNDPQRHGVDMMKELHTFYHQHYYAYNMRLVVVGAYSLDELEKHVVEYFSNVPALPRLETQASLRLDRNHAGTWIERVHTSLSQLTTPFPSDTLQCIYRIVPVKDMHSLTITWPIPSQRRFWKSRPCDYISHLLGHESAGSLLSMLKEKRWANGCYAGVGASDFENASSHALFSITFTLTEEGVDFWKEIVTETYEYIGMLRYYCNSSSGFPPYIYDELRKIQEFSFQFEDEPNPSDLVEKIAEYLAPYKEISPERLLDGEVLLQEFDVTLIKNLVNNFLQPHNARLDLVSSSFGRAADFMNEEMSGANSHMGTWLALSTRHIEPYFNTQYWCQTVSPDLIDLWANASTAKQPSTHSKIYLPRANPYIPSNFDLKPLPLDDSHHPLLNCSIKLCVSVGKSKLWFPATVTRFDGVHNRILVSHEDDEEKWYKVDVTVADISRHSTVQDFEGTLDSKKVKFKVTSVPIQGQLTLSRHSDGFDNVDEDVLHFPTIPPVQAKARLPCIVADTKYVKLWHLQDRKFKRPKAEFRINIFSSETNLSPKHRACAELLTILCHDACTETCYLASICELNSSLSTTDSGFTLRVHGFNDKILDLTEAILKVFFSFRCASTQLPSCVLPGRFEKNVESLLRKYGNFGMASSALCGNIRLRCLRKEHWSAFSKAEGIRSLSVDEFMVYSSQILGRVFFEAFFHGNVDRDDADKASNLITRYAIQVSEQKPKLTSLPVLMVPLSVSCLELPCIDVSEPNTAVEVYLQIGKDSIRHRVLIDLLVHMIHEPLFDQLRTKEQFGYDVHCSARWTYGVMGISFCVVSSSKSAQEITERLEQFLIDFRETLTTMSFNAFLENLISLAETKLESFTSLEDECNHLWYEINEHRYEWEVNRNEVVALRSITLQDALSAYDTWLYPPTSKRRLLVVQILGVMKDNHSATVHSSHDEVSRFIDDQVNKFHQSLTTWGKIY